MGKLRIFISYSREDEAWKDKLLPHLGVLLHRQDIEIWHDRTIATGAYWHEMIVKAIEQSAAAVLLISPYFLNSDYIRSSEIPLLLKAAHESGLKLFPVVVQRCAWKQLDWLSRLQVCSDDQPLSERSAPDVDALFVKLVSDMSASSALRLARPSSEQSIARTNLSPPATSFIGRARELEELKGLLAKERVRLITITGPPGIGKTRLSQQLGLEIIDRFSGGCWFADLVEAVSVTGIALPIAQSLNLSLASGYMTPQDAIVELIRLRVPLLLILDNFEQVVAMASETVGYWLAKLPDVKFLITSREILNLSAEHEYRLDVLSVPPTSLHDLNIGDVQAYESVRLFVDRARQSRPDFLLNEASKRSVARICTTLQGIPLAIELAAARIRVFSPEQIADKLGEKLRFLRSSRRDEHDRHQTLKGSIEWSYQLLKPWEQNAFLQLCIFRGDFFLEAAESIVDLSGFADAPPVCDVVQGLCEKSLLNVHQARYGLRFDMYVAIQDYGQEIWQKDATLAEQEALPRRWANFYIPYAQEWNAKVHSTDGVQALNLLSLELENLFGIQDWFLEHGMPEIGARAILAFAETMAVRGPAHLRVPRLEMSLAKISDENRELQVRLLTSLSAAHWSLGQWNEATELADKAVGLLTDDDYSAYAASAFRQHGRIRTDRGHLRLALNSLVKAKDIFVRLGDRSGISIIDGDMAGVFDRLGDFKKSLALVLEAEAMVREVGDETQRAWVLNRRGLVLWHHGQAEAAVECFEEAEVINQALGATSLIGGNRTNQGLALADLDEFDRSLAQFQSAERIHLESGNQAWAAVNYGGWGRALLMRCQPGDLEHGLELILRAERLSRKVYYPENISLHAGDRGRGLFLLGRTAEARKALREAVAIERAIGASKDLRHFSNLVVLARIEEAMGHDEECREAILSARNLERTLGISKNHKLRGVRENVAYLEDIQASLDGREISEKKISRLLAKCGRAPILPAELEQIGDAMLRASDEYSYEYPWTGLEKELEAQRRTTIKLFGYGSLLNRESAARTFPGPERFIPAIAFGVVRLFNFEMPDAVRARYEALGDSLERGLLNAEVTGFMSDVANGVLVEVGLEEIEPLRVREVGYDLRPVICVPWDQEMNAPVVAYLLSCPDRLWQGRPLTNPDLLPHRGYFAQCSEGAASFSKSFLRFWRDTTFLGDGETRAAKE